jgi:hypothetical protein
MCKILRKTAATLNEAAVFDLGFIDLVSKPYLL